MRILVLFLGLLAANVGWADTATVVDGTRVNLRSGKTDTYRVIKALEPGTELQVLRLEHAYVQVKTDGGEVGWLPLRLVSINTTHAAPAPTATPKSDPSLQELREEIQRAQQELKQSHIAEPIVPWGMIGGAAAAGLLLGIGLGMAGLQAYYRKRLHGLRI